MGLPSATQVAFRPYCWNGQPFRIPLDIDDPVDLGRVAESPAAYVTCEECGTACLPGPGRPPKVILCDGCREATAIIFWPCGAPTRTPGKFCTHRTPKGTRCHRHADYNGTPTWTCGAPTTWPDARPCANGVDGPGARCRYHRS